jgi:hypothetical protein
VAILYGYCAKARQADLHLPMRVRLIWPLLGHEPVNLPGVRLTRVRYAPIADQIPRRSDLTLRANKRNFARRKSSEFFRRRTTVK